MRKLPMGSIVLARSAAAFAHDGPPMVSGAMTKIDEAADKITLENEKDPNLSMEAMIMVYPVKDPAMLKGFKPADNVKFNAEEVNGQANVVEIKKTK